MNSEVVPNMHYQLFIISQWQDPMESDRHTRWTREFWAATHRLAGGGVSVNELGQDDGEDRVKAGYGSNYDRLVALKNTYDPINFFGLNPNIKPTEGSGGYEDCSRGCHMTQVSEPR